MGAIMQPERRKRLISPCQVAHNQCYVKSVLCQCPRKRPIIRPPTPRGYTLVSVLEGGPDNMYQSGP